MDTLDTARQIYVRLPNWVGDVLLATPFLRGLRQAAPQAHIVAHGKSLNLSVIEHEGLFDTAVPFQRGRGPWGPWREGRRVRALTGTPDLALLLPNSFSSALTARATSAPRRVGYALDRRGLLLTDAIPVVKQGRLRPIPMVDYYLGLLRHLGASTDDLPRRPLLSDTSRGLQETEAFWKTVHLPPDARPWAINLGGSWETKRWVPEHAGQLAARLRERGETPLLLWGPGEQHLAHAAQRAAGFPVPGAEHLLPLRALRPALARCRALITTDSGPRHFGIAAGIPVLVLVGSTHPGYTEVDYPDYRVLCLEVDCWPCHLKRCPIDFRCMQRLTADHVLTAADALLAAADPTP